MDKKYETMNINDLHRYNLTPKKTTLKKAKPPFGLKIFKVKIKFKAFVKIKLDMKNSSICQFY